MQTLQFKQKIGADRILHIEVPALVDGEEVEGVVVIQRHLNGSSKSWVDELYGSCADDPIERPDQGQWEEREELL